jgi:hypothetical protein
MAAILAFYAAAQASRGYSSTQHLILQISSSYKQTASYKLLMAAARLQ